MALAHPVAAPSSEETALRVTAGPLLLPVDDQLAALLPSRGLQRGGVVAVDGARGTGATSVLLHLVARASTEGSWVAFVGLPDLGWLAAAETGLDLTRVAVVSKPGKQWPLVTAALLDAIDVVVVCPPMRISPHDARRLASRARERKGVLVVVGNWPERVELRLTACATRWEGLGDGHGVLQRRTITVTSAGRGAATRQRRADVVA